MYAIGLLLLCCTQVACAQPADSDPLLNYTFRKGSPDGIGKWYMGREIAWVMGHQGIGWLERPEREIEEQPSQLLLNMAIQPGEILADIGAGSGYHSRMMAQLTGAGGRVKAVDIQPEMLRFMAAENKKAGITHIDTVLGTERMVPLAKASIDKMLLVDVYHELAFPREMARSMLDALKPGGKLFLVEFRTEDPEVPIKPLHKMTEKQARLELEHAGFVFLENMGNLPWQHCLVFTKPLNEP